MLGLEPSRVERIHAAGVLHDLGKLGIADAILYKPAALDDSEWEEIKRHPEIGARILLHAGLTDISQWVRAHHERIDGGGYPDRLSATEIPLEARILAVAEAYVAMTGERPYAHTRKHDDALSELLRCAGSQFDDDVVNAFVRASVLRPRAVTSEEALRAHCAARLAPYKVPKQVALVSGPLPRTRSGKLLRRELT